MAARALEFYNCGVPAVMMDAWANVSALVACEVQCVCEAFRAEKAGGVYIKV